MLFNSFIFIFAFLPMVLAIFLALARRRGAQVAVLWMILSSLVFYMYWNPAHLPIFLVSIVINYAIGSKLALSTSLVHRRALLVAGLGFNLLLLAFFKYTGFVVETVSGRPVSESAMAFVATIGLPIGISFYTFLQIAFLVDVYRDRPRYSLPEYGFFVAFFPHLIAGPILHHAAFIPQISRIRERLRGWGYVTRWFAPGVALFVIGLAKKTILADALGSAANLSFDAAAAGKSVTFLEAWGGAFAYGLQIYFDFSAYSDMAIGLGLMFGLILPLNFNSPYQANSVIDFWRRWHMTLSRFLRDYLYIPLGGNRLGPVRRYANVMITMLLGGLWHGAGFTFILWGALHGAFLVANHVLRSALHLHPPKALAVAITLFLVMLAWVPFRASSLDATWIFYEAMLGFKGIAIPQAYGEWVERLGVIARWLDIHGGTISYIDSWRQPLLLAIGLVIALALPNAASLILERRGRSWIVRTRFGAAAAGLMAALALVVMYVTDEVVFLYFQF